MVGDLDFGDRSSRALDYQRSLLVPADIAVVVAWRVVVVVLGAVDGDVASYDLVGVGEVGLVLGVCSGKNDFDRFGILSVAQCRHSQRNDKE